MYSKPLTHQSSHLVAALTAEHTLGNLSTISACL